MNIKNLLLGILLSIFGLLMLFMPQFCMKILVILVGCYYIFTGVTNLLSLRKGTFTSKYRRIVLYKNIAGITLGLLSILFPFFLMKTFAGIWNFVSYILAIALVLYAISGFVSASLLDDSNKELKKHIASESIICLFISIIMFVLPIEVFIKTAFRIIGVIALIIGLAICAFEIIMKKQNKTKNTSNIEIVDIKDEKTDN